MFGVPRPLKVGGLRLPTFPGTSGMDSGSIFSIFDLKKFEYLSVSGAQFLIPKFLIRPAGCIGSPALSQATSTAPPEREVYRPYFLKETSKHRSDPRFLCLSDLR